MLLDTPINLLDAPIKLCAKSCYQYELCCFPSLFSPLPLFPSPSLLLLLPFRTNVVMNYSDVETKVREATNDDSWGPPGTLMGEISKYTYTYEHHPEVMAMLWKRMFESKKNWRRTYKVNYL